MTGADDERKSDLGVFGMGVMGQNLALNAADNGFVVSAYNRPDEFQERIWGALDRAKKEGRKDGKGEMQIHPFTELEPFVASLRVPRRILLSIPAGRVPSVHLRCSSPCFDFLFFFFGHRFSTAPRASP
jgi:6-phosphogluconate dehydrogenase